MKTYGVRYGIFLLIFFIMACEPGENQKEEPPEAVVTEMTAAEATEVEITYDVTNPKSILTAVEQAVGGWDALWKKGDVQFDYYYEYPDKKDVSVERYVFDNGMSWAKYTTHNVNVMPDTEGTVIQCFDGSSAMVSHEGDTVADPQVIGTAAFLRQANYFWFTMPYRLDEPGTIHEYLGQEEVKGIVYDKVKVTYDPAITGKEQNDTYIVYVNPETRLIDQFYFSLPFFGVEQPVLFMEVEYEKIGDLMLPTKRFVYQPNEKGEYPDQAGLIQTSTNIKFNNGFNLEDLAI